MNILNFKSFCYLFGSFSHGLAVDFLQRLSFSQIKLILFTRSLMRAIFHCVVRHDSLILKLENKLKQHFIEANERKRKESFKKENGRGLNEKVNW